MKMLKKVALGLMLCCGLAGGAMAEELVLPRDLVTIEDGAFYADASMRSVVVPEGARRIGSRAFADSGLVAIELPDSMEYIARDAFENCDGLEVYCSAENSYVIRFCENQGITCNLHAADAGDFTIQALDAERCAVVAYYGDARALVIPDEIGGMRVAAIGDIAFKGNQTLRTVHLPQYLEEIGEDSFKDTDLLDTVYFSPDIKSIGSTAFVGEQSVRFICRADWDTAQALVDVWFEVGFGGNDGFYSPFSPDFRLRKEVDVDGSARLTILGYDGSATVLQTPAAIDGIPVTKIESLYPGNERITSLILHEGLSELAGVSNSSALKYVHLPDSLRVLGDYCFQSCTSLASVSLPSGLQVIPYGAFDDCSALKTMVIPEGVTRIENYAFSGCTSLKNIYIPDSVRKIGTVGEDWSSENPAQNVFGYSGESWPTICCEEYSYAASWADLYGVPYKYPAEGLSPYWVSLPDSLQMYEGMQISLRAEIFLNDDFNNFYDKQDDLCWQSSHPEIVSVDENGTLTAHSLGTSTIMAYYDYSDALDFIEVTVIRLLQSFDLSTEKLEMKVRESCQLEICNLQPEGSQDNQFTWSSSDPVIAMVDQTGKVTARAIGEVVITATSSNGIERSCLVIVSRPN